MSMAALAAVWIPSCAPVSPPADPTPVRPKIYHYAVERMAAVVVSGKDELNPWIEENFRKGRGPEDADGGSAVPITPDGYFITADHVLAHAPGRHVFVLHAQTGKLKSVPARIVWRSGAGDVALLKIEEATPKYYQWAPSGQWIPEGTPVMHAGIATGFKSSPGKMVTGFAPNAFGHFKYDIPLQPGDSGGPVVNARGELVGVNSAVEFLVPIETAFFIESEANRPNTYALQKLIERDRSKNGVPAPVAAPQAASPAAP